MNVKPGQRVIQIKSSCGNEGKIGTVIEFLGDNPILGEYEYVTPNMIDCWLIEYDNIGNIIDMISNRIEYNKLLPVPDAWLRPISDIEDNEDVTEEIKELITNE